MVARAQAQIVLVVAEVVAILEIVEVIAQVADAHVLLHHLFTIVVMVVILVGEVEPLDAIKEQQGLVLFV
jgi:hypothetical protein